MSTQEHTRRAAFDPAEYAVEGILDTHNDSERNGWQWLDEKNLSPDQSRTPTEDATEEFDNEVAQVEWRCVHCGRTSGMLTVAFVRHIPTGTLVMFGSHCMADAFAGSKLELREAVTGKAAAIRKARAEWEAANPEQSAALDIYEEEVAAGGAYDQFLADLSKGRRLYGALTEGQTPWPLTAMLHRANRIEWEAEKVAKMANVPALPEGRYEITGTVRSTKWQENDFGGNLKMLVEFDDGNRVWGTVPKALGFEGLQDRRVTLTAKVERSQNDDHFGFYSRPSKAAYLDEEATR
jgi:hypothetical protein